MQVSEKELLQIKDEALKLLNSAREAIGEEPLQVLPQGVRFSPGGSSLARGLPEDVLNGPATLVFPKRLTTEARKIAEVWQVSVKSEADTESLALDLPKALVDFTTYFDANFYPELLLPN